MKSCWGLLYTKHKKQYNNFLSSKKIVNISMNACKNQLTSLPSIRSRKCYSCVCLKGEFPKCEGKNMKIFVYMLFFV